MKKQKLANLLIALLLVLQVFISPLSTFAQEANAGVATPATEQTQEAKETGGQEADGGQAAQPAAEEDRAAKPNADGQDSGKTDEAEATQHYPQAPIQEAQYTMTTDFKINNNPVQNPGKYGEGKFYIIPTYKFADNATLQNGDTLTYTVPSVFRVEQSGPVEIKAGDNVTTVASLTTNPANNTATITITNAEYYAHLNENKSLTALFTAVWADSTPKNIEQTFDLPGAGEYKLMRIVPDVDPTGYTKWGNQDRDNPELVNWRIRINRYAKPGIVNAMVRDTIPEGQEVVPDSFSGYYFTDWEAAQNGGTAGGRVAYTGGEVNIEDDNHFTITPSNGGSLDGRGLLIIFQTRITAPVDLVTKKVFNNYTFTSATHSEDVNGFAALTTTDGVGTGARPDEIIFEVNKTLNGRSLNQGEFSFELVDSSNQVVATATNDENGVVKFKKMKFRTAGNFTYKIREVNNNLPGVTYDKNIITATVTVTDNGGAKTAAVTYTKPGFTNTYKAASVTKVLKATKALVGANLVDDQFTFELVNKETGQVAQTAKSKADGTVTFPAETYTAVGNYTYIIREKNDGAKGYTYDTKAPEVTVAVTDNGQGQLVATETYATPAEFTNNYQALSTTAAFSFTKKLTGRAQKAGEFSFDLTAPEAKDNQTKATADENGTVNFDPITYTQAGVYEYTVKEQNGKLGGITYDEKAYKVKVTVTDKAGQLEATVEYPDGQEISNTYQAASVSKVLKASKALTGANLADDQFTFELVNKATDQVVQTAKNKADGTVTFPAETYTEVGNHTYIIREKNDGSKGYTYDDKTVEVTVAVTDNGQGQLVATETYATPAEFSNNYQALSTTASFSFTKKLTGRAQVAGEFSFDLTAPEAKDNQTKATADENGTVNFDPITYTQTGVYEYTVKEQNGKLGGVTYDDKTYRIKVTVTDKAGQLEAAVEYPDGQEITNVYQAGSVSKVLKATKALTGKNLADDQFTFELVNKETGQVAQTAKSKADGTVTFPAETYTAVGNYTYIIREKNDGAKGYTYDTKAPEVTVAVTDNGQGQLVATETYATPAEFTNNYQALSTTAAFSFTKKLTGRAQKAGEFSFDLTAPEAKDNQTKATADENGTVNFDPITYTQAGVYEYTVKEQNGKLGGITYDEKAYKVKVTVTDKAGQLEATVEYPDGQEISNTYQAASVSKVLKASKALTGANLADDQFTFELVNKATDQVVQTAKNKADGTVTFPAETYTEVGNHTYIIREKNDGSKGYTYDGKNVEVTVAVTDNGQGELVATETYATPASFTNNYQALSTSAAISVTKALTGRPQKAGEFSFDLIEEGATSAAQTKVNAENGSVAFDAITYTKPGTYKYTVKEQAGNVAGVTYSTQVLNVTVKVTDNAGQLEATVEYPDGQTITNAYKAAAADVTIKAKKVLKGKALVANAFTFELVDASTNKVVDTAKNDANGDVTFKAQSLSSAGAYTYSVREKLDANDKGMTYDSSNILVHVRVTDNLAGQLEATVTPDKELTFTNSYKPLDQNVTLMATKRMEGRALQANEFNFVLKDADGKELQRVANDATGKVSFEPITYSAVGTYTYTIAEVSGDAKGVTYDAKEVKVTVEVKDDNGQLVATPSYEQEPVFTNRYAAASTKQALSVKKVLEGRALEAGEFEFELLDEQGTKLASAKNDAEGNVTFEEQTYSKVGTRKYRIQEVNNGLKNVTYDTKVVEATVEVVDNQAQLTPSVTYTHDATFTNTYKAVDPGQPSFSVDAMKELEGREMKADEFQFNLLDSNGNLVATAKNDASGKIHLEHTITNPSEGTFTYKVVEKDLGDKEITYDKTVHEVSVTVSKDSEGKFQAKVDSAKSIVFKNTYKPVKEEKKLPKTGEAEVVWLTALASMMVMGAIAVLLLDKKARS
ncbi:Spy0128 family protein [uncultured Abiotrophia sp.]|uniref:Spy0128 family protein n=1 Tax=uncultured Abiotrophia sp. TaxID=316094 RepID=UPI0028D59AA4|nr:FctA domain-containing protein [uncultured Abiotrophia sp.]